jgi:hypothetical protein
VQNSAKLTPLLPSAQTRQVSKETYYRGKRDLLHADFGELASVHEIEEAIQLLLRLVLAHARKESTKIITCQLSLLNAFVGIRVCKLVEEEMELLHVLGVFGVIFELFESPGNILRTRCRPHG